MHFSHALVALAAASFASAQLDDIPSCALSCFTEALGGDGCSKLTDFKCHCGKTELVDKVVPCVKKDCDKDGQSSASAAVVSVCKAAGVPISVPPIGGDDDSSSAAPTPTGSSSSGSAEPTGDSSSEEPTDAPTDAPTETAPPSGGVPTGTGGSTATGTGSLTMTGKPTASTPAEFPGAGSNIAPKIGGVAAAFLAVAAYL